MAANVRRYFEYTIECDVCGAVEVLHTGDEVYGIYVHSIPTAIRAAEYGWLQDRLLCCSCRFKYNRHNLPPREY